MRKIISLRAFQLVIIIFVAAFVGYFFGTNNVHVALKKYQPVASITSKTPPPGQNLNMGLFYQILEKVNQDYYDKSKIDTLKIQEGAINGMLGSLGDPYTSFFPPKQNTEFKTQLAGQFSGIGAELSATTDNRIIVVAPLDDSPAQKAGIKAGDLVLKVNNESTFGWSVQKAVDTIRGQKGTPIELTISHDKDGKNPKNLKIIRDTIVIKSVSGWVKGFSCPSDKCAEESSSPKVAYIRLSQFGDNTDSEWVSVINSINDKIRGKNDLKGIVLDLRNNPGGYLNDAVFIASEFLKDGVVVMQEDGARNRESLSVSRVGTLLDYPVVVLINKGSASASEITAGALRDHDRAQLLGEISFGKGTVQQAIDLDGGGSVHVSVAKWLTPNGTWVNKVGLTPDIEVKFDASKSAKLSPGIDNQLNAAIGQLLK